MTTLTPEQLKRCAHMCAEVYSKPEDWMVEDDGDTLFIAIEGTDDAGDWVTNISFLFRSDDTHRGFKRNAWRVFHEMFAAGVFFNVPKDKQVVLCGHSLGGATATVLMDFLCNIYFNIALVTFGSPRPGGRALRKRLAPQTHYRFVHGSDVVPKTPPYSTGYVHTHPKVQLLDTDTKIFDGVEDHSMANYIPALTAYLVSHSTSDSPH